MRRRPRTVAPAIVLVVAVVTSCTADDVRPAARPTPGPACAGSPLRGYAMTGDVSAAVLRPLALCPVELGAPVAPDRLRRVSWLTGTGAAPTLADYTTGRDLLWTVADGRAAPHAAARDGHAPAVARDGRLAYVVPPAPGARPRFVVRLHDPATGRGRVVADLPVPVSGLAWSPGGKLAFVADTGAGAPSLWAVESGAERARRVGILPARTVSLFWPRPGALVAVVAVGDAEAARAVVVDAAGRELVRVAEPWRPVGTTPDGALLVLDRHAGTLARVAAPSWDAPLAYGTLPPGERVWQVVV